MFPNAAIMDSSGTSLFPLYLTRDDARRAASPFEVPIADASYKLKPWADPNPVADAGGMVTYQRLPLPGDTDPATGKQATTLIPFKVPAKWASAYNLPGLPNFAEYVPMGTQAQIPATSNPAGPSYTLDAFMLSTAEQAQRLQEELGVGGEIKEAQPGQFPIIYGEETRRVFVIIPPWPDALALIVGFLLRSKNAHGVGMPGHWDRSNPNSPVWIFENINVNTGAETEFTPAKPVPEGYSIVMTMFGQAIYAKLGG